MNNKINYSNNMNNNSFEENSNNSSKNNIINNNLTKNNFHIHGVYKNLQNEISCDICSYNFKNEYVITCKECNLNLCIKHLNEFNNNENKVHFHYLNGVKNYENLLCSKCNNNISNKFIMKCNNCDFNICFNCYINNNNNNNNNNINNFSNENKENISKSNHDKIKNNNNNLFNINMDIEYSLIYHFHPIILKNSTSNNSNKCSFCNVSLKSNFYLCKECKFALCDLCIFKILYHNNKIHQHSCTLSKKKMFHVLIVNKNLINFYLCFAQNVKLIFVLNVILKKIILMMII